MTLLMTLAKVVHLFYIADDDDGDGQQLERMLTQHLIDLTALGGI